MKLALVQSARTLTTITAALRAAHEASVFAFRRSLDHAKTCGALLIEVKENELVPHGEWHTWIETHCPFSPRTAQKYMRLARTPLPGCHTIEEALSLLADSKPPSTALLANEHDVTLPLGHDAFNLITAPTPKNTRRAARRFALPDVQRFIAQLTPEDVRDHRSTLAELRDDLDRVLARDEQLFENSRNY